MVRSSISHWLAGFPLVSDHALTRSRPRLEVVSHGGVALKGLGGLSGKKEGFGGKEGLDLVLDVVCVGGGGHVHVLCWTLIGHRLVHITQGYGPLLVTVTEFRAALEGLVGGHFGRLRLQLLVSGLSRP